MLKLPPQFVRELENVDRKSFGLLEIQSAGVSDEATTEADWGANILASNVDYTSTPPAAGDVMLSTDSGYHDGATSYPNSDISTALDTTGTPHYAQVDDWNDTSDYLSFSGTAPFSVSDHFGVDIATLKGMIPDTASIYSVVVKGYVNATTAYGGATVGIRINGSDYFTAKTPPSDLYSVERE
ncbi:MAG: hypothetical protein P1S46_11770, partial [bacterium]|nr:hypothetical protein [bacterium]